MSQSFKALVVILALTIAVSCAREVQAFGLGRLGAGFGKLGAITNKSGGVTPSACSGVIDASKGCPLPMLGS